MTRFERLSLWLSVAIGLAGCVLGAASWFQSHEALALAKATARPYVEATGLTFAEHPREGGQVEFRLQVKNFGQTPALDVAFRYRRSDGVFGPVSNINPILNRLSAGDSDSLVVFGERFKSGEQVTLIGLLEYTDSVTRERVSGPVCFAESARLSDASKPRGTFEKCLFERSQ